MRIFILEDDQFRQKWFQKKFAKHILDIADNVEEAKKILSTNPQYDVGFLDHDLDHRVYVSSNEENTGYALCKWMKENKEYAPYQIIIHSLNVVGGDNMQTLLSEFHNNIWRVPFFNLADMKVD